MVTLRELLMETIQQEIFDQIYYNKTSKPDELDLFALADKLIENYDIKVKEDE